MASKTSRPGVVLITGSGRSGTTWLGEMMRTFPPCVYKYEPFPPQKATPYHAWVKRLADGDDAELAREFFALACTGYIDIDRPPFTSAALQTPAQILPLLYKICSRVERLKPLYTAATRFSLDEATVLVKDVWIPNSFLPRFVDVLDASIVTIVRHPYASVASALRGIDMGVFEGEIEGKRRRVRELHAGYPSFVDPDGLMAALDDLNPVQLEALRWRLEAEPTAEYVEQLDRGAIVVYERLVEDPLGELSAIFDFLGWQVGPETERYIGASRTTDTREGKDQYYSTNRAPREALDGWRSYITDQQLDDIAAVVKSSPLLTLWPD